MTEDINAILCKDFQAFCEKSFSTLNPSDTYHDNWHLQVFARALDQCREGANRRLLILAPPRSLKSHMVSVAFPAYILGHNPSAKIIVASYGSDLATKLSNDTRSIIKSESYQQTFPKTQIRDKDTQTLFETTAHGARYATTVGGPLTGLGADILIIDDPMKANEAASENARNNVKEWFNSTALTRLDDPKRGVIIVVMQRLHVDDLAGHLIEQGGWTVLKFPARAEVDLTYPIDHGRFHLFKAGSLLDPERLGEKELDERRKAMGTAAFDAQYMQEPTPPSGGIFKWNWFQSYDDDHPDFSELIMSVDVAASEGRGNYSAFTIWGHRDHIWYFVAAYRVQYELPEVRRKLQKLDERHRPDLIVVDAVGVGRGLAQELRWEGWKHVLSISRPRGKQIGAEHIVPMVEAGRVRVPKSATGLSDFRDEIIAFPNGKYSDQVDSMVQLLGNAASALSRARGFKRSEREHVKSKGSLSVKTISIKHDSLYFGNH